MIQTANRNTTQPAIKHVVAASHSIPAHSDATQPTLGPPSASTATPGESGAAPSVSPSRPGTLTLLTEPQAGIQPWLNAINAAHSVIDVNEYLLTNSDLTGALRAAANRGVRVDVIVDGHPYRDSSAPGVALAALTGSGVSVQMAPARFEGSYSFDHAKYLIIDPGQAGQEAILGSPNATASAFDGENAEDAIATTDASTISALAVVFHADWTNTQAGPSPRSYLVLSPGAGPTLTSLLGQAGPVEVIAEELGDTPSCYQALEAHGSGARVLVPSYLSGEAASYASQLVRKGVQVRTLSSPYVHAKLIITPSATFVGSQNFSVVSFNDNREVGLVATDSAVHAQALGWFDGLWNEASLWTPSASGATSTQGDSAPSATTPTSPNSASTTPAPAGGSGSAYPYLPFGDSEFQVTEVWGPPTSTTTDIYDGYPETVWIYPEGRVYFKNGAVSYVQRDG
ncbi:MAG: phospholipase D-like domain-containing protein [Ferrimicrobium sp.]